MSEGVSEGGREGGGGREGRGREGGGEGWKEQGRTQDLTKGGAHAHAQIIDGCGLSYCTRTRSERQTANTSAR